MSTIHRTTIKPTKVELLTTWLPTRPWFRNPGTPELTKSGGFRLDDPEGEVGIEFMVVTDTSTPDEPIAYLVPLTYRGAPLAGADHALVGTPEHGVLGKRWVYDGVHDPVLVTELLALIEGRAQAMAQSISDTPDHEVVRSYTGTPFPPIRTGGDGSDFKPVPIDDQDGTRLPAPHDTILQVHRVLRPVAGGKTPASATSATATTGNGRAIGHVARSWQAPDGGSVAAVFATLLATPYSS